MKLFFLVFCFLLSAPSFARVKVAKSGSKSRYIEGRVLTVNSATRRLTIASMKGSKKINVIINVNAVFHLDAKSTIQSFADLKGKHVGLTVATTKPPFRVSFVELSFKRP